MNSWLHFIGEEETQNSTVTTDDRLGEALVLLAEARPFMAIFSQKDWLERVKKLAGKAVYPVKNASQPKPSSENT